MFEDEGAHVVATYHSTVPRKPKYEDWRSVIDGIPWWVTTNKSMLSDALGQFYRKAVCRLCTSFDTVAYYVPNGAVGYNTRRPRVVKGIFELQKLRCFVLAPPGLKLGATRRRASTGELTVDVDVHPLNIGNPTFDNLTLEDSKSIGTGGDCRKRTLHLAISLDFNHARTLKSGLSDGSPIFQPRFTIDLSHLEKWNTKFSSVEFSIREPRVPWFIARGKGGSWQRTRAYATVVLLLQKQLKSVSCDMIGTEDCISRAWVDQYFNSDDSDPVRLCDPDHEYWHLEVSHDHKNKGRKDAGYYGLWGEIKMVSDRTGMEPFEMDEV